MIDDEKIIEMFFERSEQAVRELDNKYGKICHHLSFNILNNRQDAEECVNDAYMGAWNAIPPARPHPLFPYIVKIVRNISLKLYWRKEAAKRSGHYSRAFALRRKLKTVLIAAVIMALAFSTVAAAAYLYHVFIANRHTELPSYEVGAKVEPKTISAYALEELKVKPYQTYKATYGEAEKYLDVDLLISEQLENTIFGQGVDIQGSYLKGENPITSVTLYSRHDTGATMSGYIDMSVYVSIGTSDTYQQIAQILNPELMEKDAILSEYVSETNGIAAKFAVYDTIGRASAYFVNDGILYNISVGGFVDEDNVDPANYLKELIDTFK